ncbi:50S ribosomal protein L11 methyltransferase [Desulfonema ishimotonii]|uniref:Ribosomal protein L11 methyltransferase n=1 Tax=Desulfonema ishimotonii TaxID=45657 RepID=A0A401G1L5_9BACT|nr:50S ribosomal protein L11 methyltransferase [Desulfonema ishimotonii]GBC63109.1 50S ribosomal protein L11 methyltransferase [Desulfonema ishimotonii]
MKWIQAKVTFDVEDRDLATDLISDIFYDFGLQGVVVESTVPDTTADWADGAETLPEADSVSGYFARNEQYEARRAGLETALARLSAVNGIDTQVTYDEIDEEDWAESWKEYFWPEKISDRIVVKPTWRDYQAGPDEMVLEIDPGMAFGTGTHPTTALCIRLIETRMRPGTDLLDVGTGSGILMIAAQKLGAALTVGVDSDAVAVGVARKNLLLNNISPERFDVRGGNLVDVVHRKFDMVVANILSEVILVLLDDIRTVLAEEGLFIGSGIISANREKVVCRMRELGFDILEVREEEGWVAIVGRLKHS